MKTQIGSYECQLFDDGKFVFVETQDFNGGQLYEFQSLGMEVEKLTSIILCAAELVYQKQYCHKSLVECAEQGLIAACNKICNEFDLAQKINQYAINHIEQSLLLIYGGDEAAVSMKLSNLYISALEKLAKQHLENSPSQSTQAEAFSILETIAQVQGNNLFIDISHIQNDCFQANGGTIEIITDQLSLANDPHLETSTFGQESQTDNVIIHTNYSISIDDHAAIFTHARRCQSYPQSLWHKPSHSWFSILS